MPDVGIQGLIFALPDTGDRLVMFQLDLKSVNSRSKAADPKKGGTNIGPKTPKQGFSSTSDCTIAGDVAISKLEPGDKII